MSGLACDEQANMLEGQTLPAQRRNAALGEGTVDWVQSVVMQVFAETDD